MKNEKGITLAALVISVIVLMIIASIAVYSGIGTVRYARYNKARSEMEVMQGNVNNWYQEYQNAGTPEEKQAVIDKHGVSTEDPSCDQTALTTTGTGAGIEITSDYRYISADMAESELGLNNSNDFLINIPLRTVLLFGGLKYNGETYYTVEDFGLLIVKSSSISSVSFELIQKNTSPEVYIYNLNFKDDENRTVNISKFKVLVSEANANNWLNVTNRVTETTYNNAKAYLLSGLEYGKTYDVKITTTDNKIEENNIVTIAVIPRPGISVGDYITYTSPTASVTCNEVETGYSNYATTPATLTAKDTFRVMEISDDGSMLLMGAITSEDPTIGFKGALGYNNAVYTLNTKCSELYKDEERGITARSIKVEDITDKFNQTGKNILTNNVSNQLTSLQTTLTNNSTTNVTVDYTNKKVTYSNGYTYYPDIFQYEVEGLINSTTTTGEVGQSEVYSKYNYNGNKGLTDLTSKKATTSLTVPYTYYNTTHASTDFADNEKAEAYQKMFFGTSTSYWLASRCIFCGLDSVGFGVRYVGSSRLGAYGLYASYDDAPIYDFHVCPVVYLPSSVEVTASTDTSTYHQSHPHEVQ